MSEVVFNFFDPTDILIRLIALSPLGARDENLAFFPEDSPSLHDYCHGERMKQIHDSMPFGSVPLNAILFFDEINRDQKGFSSGDGALIVGGFFRQRQRESTYAKSSLGTCPQVPFPKVQAEHDRPLPFVMFVVMFIVVFVVMFVVMFIIMKIVMMFVVMFFMMIVMMFVMMNITGLLVAPVRN